MNEDEFLDYLTAKIYALASQHHYIGGHEHPFYKYALKEFCYILDMLAKQKPPSRSADKLGVYIARSIRKSLQRETAEQKIKNHTVALLSWKQAYRLAQCVLYYEIDLKTAIEIDCEDND